MGRSVGFAFPGNGCVKKKSPWQQRLEIMEYWVEGKGGGAREEVERKGVNKKQTLFFLNPRAADAGIFCF